jgi:hypothetical protein
MGTGCLTFFVRQNMKDVATHGSFDDIVALAGDAVRPICLRLRELVVSLHKGAYEIVWPKHRIASYGVGPKKMTEHYAYIGVQKSHVNLGFYYGTSLPDTDGLLEGTGKKLRHLKIRSLDFAESSTVRALLKAAIAERRAQLSK